MLNYAVNECQKKSFILNFVIENDKIIVNMADGSKQEYPNSEENKIMLLDQMKEQVVDALHMIPALKDQLKRKYLYEVVLLLLVGSYSYYVFSNKTDNFTFGGILDGLFLGLLGANSFALKEYKKLYNDFNKNYLFITNEDLFNGNIPFNERGLNKKTSEFLKDKREITLNDLDNISYKNFNKLVESQKFNRDFNDTVKTRKLKRN